MLVTTSADRWVAPLIVREDGNIAALLQDTMHPQWVSHPLIPHGLVILVGEQNTRGGCKSYKRVAKWYREKKKRGTPLHTTFYHPNGRLSPKNNCEKHNVLRSKALWHYRPTRSTRGNQRMKKGIQLLRRPTTQWLYNWIKNTSWISFFLGWFGYEIPLNICFENIQTTRFSDHKTTHPMFPPSRSPGTARRAPRSSCGNWTWKTWETGPGLIKRDPYIGPGIPTTIKTMGVNITTIAYLRVLIIGIGSTIILMVVESQGWLIINLYVTG